MNQPPPSTISRRDFLSRTMTGVGAGLVLGAPNILRAANADGSDKIHVGLIGMGKQGTVLFEAMSNIPGLHFQAVCDIWDYSRNNGIRKVKSLQGHEPKGYVDIDDMLANEKGLDAVVIATPDFWHSPLTVKCLEAGLNVYCEKMMSNTIDGARAMVKAMEKSGKLCQIGHQRRSNPRYRFVLNHLINGNKICGRIGNINGQWNRAVNSSQDIAVAPSLALKQEILEKYGFKNMHQFMNWRTYRDLSGGPISDLGAHQIVWLTGALDHDNTGGHVDNLACFVAPRVVVALACDDPQDPQYAPLQDNLRRLRAATDARGRALEIVELPQPARPEYGDGRLSPSYVNFYVADGGVVMPGFGDPRDEEARAIVARLFPGRDVVQLQTMELAKADGNVHCVTQQQPAA